MDPSMASSSSDGEGPRSASTGSRRATADGSVAGSRSGSSGRRPGMQLPPPLAPNTVEAAAEGQVMYMSGPGGGGGSDRPSYANDQQQQLSSSSSSSAAAAGGGAMYANASAESTKQAANPAALYATPQKNKRPRKKSGGGTGTLERPQTHYANADAMAQSRPGYKNVSDATGGASASPVYAVPENISGGGSSSGAYRNTEGVAASSAAASPTYAVPTSTAGRSGRGSRGSRGSRGGGAAPVQPESAYAIAEGIDTSAGNNGVAYANLDGVDGGSSSDAPLGSSSDAPLVLPEPAYAVAEVVQPAAAVQRASTQRRAPEATYAVAEKAPPASEVQEYANLDDIVPSSAPRPLLTNRNSEASESARSDGVEANDMYASLDI